MWRGGANDRLTVTPPSATSAGVTSAVPNTGVAVGSPASVTAESSAVAVADRSAVSVTSARVAGPRLQAASRRPPATTTPQNASSARVPAGRRRAGYVEDGACRHDSIGVSPPGRLDAPGANGDGGACRLAVLPVAA